MKRHILKHGCFSSSQIAVVVAACSLVSLPRHLSADTVYTVENGSTLVATVSSAAETNEFDSARAVELSSNAYTAFEKRGPGGLFMPADISGYTGTVRAREGSLGYRTSNSLGSLADGNGAVTVDSGATLFIPASAAESSVSPLGKSFVLSGLGVSGAGAVELCGKQLNCPMGTNITLAGETRIRNRAQYYWANSWGSPSVERRCRLDMAGNVLRLHSENIYAEFKSVDVSNPGHIVFEKKPMDITTSELGGSGANEVRFEMPYGEVASWTVRQSNTYLPMWKIVAADGENGLYSIRSVDMSYDVAYNPYPGIATNVSAWGGPVVLNGGKQVNIQSPTRWHGGVTFLGKVSGNAPLRVWGNRVDDTSNFHHPYLNLVCPENDFTGVLTMRYSGIRLWNPGAVGNPRNVQLQGGEVVFDNLCDDFGRLPPLEADCSDSTWNGVTMSFTNDVRFGRGTWESVVKKGDERLLWYSASGADELAVSNGFVKLPRRAGIAGLYSAQTNSYSSPAMTGLFEIGGRGDGSEWCRRCDLEPGVRSPNYTTHAHHNYNYKQDPSKNGDAQWSTVVYSGYVWNNSPTNETWSFVGGGNRRYRLTIGDTVVYDIDRGVANVLGHGTAVLQPGPNYFELVNYRTYKTDLTAVRSGTGTTTWNKDAFNFGYMRSGADTTVISDYRVMEDPGDGSLFTFCLPGEEFEYPRHEGETHRGIQPDFAHITFGDGAGLDLEGVTNYVAASFTGFPVITNATHFAVTNRWTIPVAAMLTGTKRLATDGRIDLSKATVCFDDADLLPSGGSPMYEICVAADGVSGLPAVEPDFMARWKVRISDDGKALQLFRVPIGTKLHIR